MTWTYVAAGALAVSIACTGGVLTDVTGWYARLRKPSWQPPDWLFAPAWSLIFALSAYSGGHAWNEAGDEATRLRLLCLFLLNGGLNVLWSFLFFKRRRPDWALMEVAALWLSIVALIVAVLPLAASSAWALAPYLAWVTFASYLNLTIVRLNRPFART